MELVMTPDIPPPYQIVIRLPFLIKIDMPFT
jgi:hypothetical protein